MPSPMRWSKDSLRALAPDVARGVRAAFVTLAPFYLASALARPELGWTALGGWLGTLADPGGPRTTRARVLLLFAVAGAPLIAVFETLAPSAGLATAALVAVAFGMSLLRAVGGSAATLGTFLTMIVAISASRARLSPLGDAAGFSVGAALALFVSSIVWPVWTHLPVRRAVAAVYEELAAYLDTALQAAAAPHGAETPWAELASSHHRRIRAAIEEARAVALAGRQRRQGETRFGGNVRALLGVAELQFPVFSSIVIAVESHADPSPGQAARLSALAATDHAVAAALGSPDMRRRVTRLPPKARAASRPPEASSTMERLVERLERGGDLVRDLLEALAFGVEDAGAARASSDAPRSTPPPASRTGSMAPRAAGMAAQLRALRDALSWRSPFFQHALRTALAAGTASLLGELLSRSRVYWVTLTTLAILQPYPGATVKRAGERVAGTVFGCIVALAITTTVRSPLVLSALLVPLSVAAVATRPRSYRLFTFFLTPLFVIITDPAHDWRTAALRAGDAVLGGAVAMLFGVLVAPASERTRAPDAIVAMLSTLGEYAAAVFASLRDPTPPGDAAKVAAARRSLGIALGAAETSLERWLAEPLRDHAFAADAMLLATYARRLGTALTSLDVVRVSEGALQGARVDVAPVATYVAAVLETAKAHVGGDALPPVPPSPPVLPPGESAIDVALERVVRWAALVAGLAQRPAEDPSARAPTLRS
jgi:uncharacterized membrane protein YccC